MSHTIPNLADAAFAPQAKPGSTDWDGIIRALAQTGVKSGCVVSERGAGANMSVDVASGTIYAAGLEVAVTSGNVAVTTAHATLPRKDIVVASSAGVKAVTAGTAALEPVAPAIPAGSIILGEIYIPAADTAINTNQITDKRAVILVPAAPAGLWNTVTATSDQTATNVAVTSPINVTQLLFTGAAATLYEVELHLRYSGNDTTGDFAWGATYPAGICQMWGWGLSTADNYAAFSPTNDTSGTLAANVSSRNLGTDAAHTVRIARYYLHMLTGSSGTFQMTFANVTASAGRESRVKAGTILRYREIV